MTKQKWIDISLPLTNEIGVWPGDTPFSFQLSASKAQTGSVNIGEMTTSVHTGTHVDAPFHFDDEGQKVHELDVNRFIGPARMVDVTSYESIGRQELEQFHLDGVTRLLLRTRLKNNPTVFPEQFTVIQEDVGPFCKEKGIRLLGTDAPSVDPLDSKTLRAHHALQRNKVAILENIMLADVHPGNYDLIALPLSIVGADASPVRAVIRPLDQERPV